MPIFTWLLLAASVCFTPVEKETSKSAFPEDISTWLKTPIPKKHSKAWQAACGSDYEWQVSLRKGRVVAHLRRDKSPGTAPVPFVLKRTRREHNKIDRLESGELYICKVSNGWLVGFNAGEWGGSLWWYSSDGEQRYRVSFDQIRQFLPTPQGIVGLEGMIHIGTSKGGVVQIIRDRQGRWKSVRMADLGHAPEVGALDSSGNIVVATTHNLVRVSPDNTVQVLMPTAFWRAFYPRSMAISPKGDIYLGMRHGVSQIHPAEGHYTADWLLPNKAFVNAKPNY